MTGREIRKDKDAALHFGVWQGAITGGRKQTGKNTVKTRPVRSERQKVNIASARGNASK